MVTRQRKQRKNASKNASKTPRRRKRTRQKLGFSVGVFLIVLAFVLMGVRTGLNTLQLDDEPDTISDQRQTQESGQAPTGSDTGTQQSLKTAEGDPSLPETAVSVPIRRHNPRTGASSAPNKIIVFGHLGCRLCRETLRVALNHVRENPTITRLVSKFALPENNSDAGIEAGLFARIAHEEQVFWDVLEHLGQANTTSATPSTTGDVLKDTQLIDALTTVGIPPTEIRKKLRENTAAYMRDIDEDLADFSALQRKSVPVVIIDGKIMTSTSGASPHTQLKERLKAMP